MILANISAGRASTATNISASKQLLLNPAVREGTIIFPKPERTESQSQESQLPYLELKAPFADLMMENEDPEHNPQEAPRHRDQEEPPFRHSLRLCLCT